MKLLLISKLARSSRAINTIAQYSRVAGKLGHEIAVFGEKQLDFPELQFSLDVHAFDIAIFIIYMPSDFPDLPYLANLLDGMPKSRRVIIDCSGRYNETIRVEHDFNHLEKMDGHQGWEWIEAFSHLSVTMQDHFCFMAMTLKASPNRSPPRLRRRNVGPAQRNTALRMSATIGSAGHKCGASSKQ